jgi:hypothetical protein
MSLAPGSRLGPYEIVERIGAGGRLVCVRSRGSQDVFLMSGLSGILPAPAR